MIKITEQYFWNLVLLVIFATAVIVATIILQTESRLTWSEVGWLDITLLGLATWRVTRLIAEDTTTRFFREQFFDLKKTTRSYALEKPAGGLRRAVLDIILDPWNLSLGVGATLTFLYFLTAYSLYPLIFLALSAAVSLLQTVLGLTAKRQEE